jgi:aspartyl-tRNA(Asn)/glutamyl-tRNA(Gln) amidotransferase subunit C
MPITKRDVEKIANLANLELTDEEKELFTNQLGAIVGYVEQLNELDTADVPPMAHAGVDERVDYAQREDLVLESVGQNVALANAPDPNRGHFRVPKVIEEG